MSSVDCVEVEKQYAAFLEQFNLEPGSVDENMFELFRANVNNHGNTVKTKFNDLKTNFEQNVGSMPKRESFDNVIDAIDNYKKDDVLVFCSNLGGTHGLGIASIVFAGNLKNDYKKAKNGQIGNYAIFGVAEGLHSGNLGMSYALPTKQKNFSITRSRNEIIKSIKKLYKSAIENPNLKYKVLYGVDHKNLSKLSSTDLAEMFAEAGPIPDNVIFQKDFSILVESKIDAKDNSVNNNPFENKLQPKLDLSKPIVQHSGGARGADVLFDNLFSYASKKFNFNFKAHHYHYKKSDSKHKVNNILTKDELIEGLEKAVAASKVIRGKATYDFIHNAFKTQSNLNDARITNPARNWFQVKNADAIYAISSIVEPGEVTGKLANGKTYNVARNVTKPIVSGGTGLAVEMAIQAGKPVYVYNIAQYGSRDVGWYQWNGKDFVKMNSVPKLTNNFAGIGSRSVASGEYKKIAVAAIGELLQENIPNFEYKDTKSSNNNYNENINHVNGLLYIKNKLGNQEVSITKNDKEFNSYNKQLKSQNNNVISFSDGSFSKTINNVDDLINIIKDYSEIISKRYKLKADTRHTVFIYDLFKLIKNDKIKFKPINFSLQKNVTKNGKNLHGLYVTNGNKIIMPFDSSIYKNNVYDTLPAQIILHEYIHSITLAAIEKNEMVRKRIRKLMDIAIEHGVNKDKLNEYAFTDEKEFMAEALTNLNLMDALDSIEVKDKTLLESARDLFNNILKFFMRTRDGKNTLLGSVLNEFYYIQIQEDISSNNKNNNINNKQINNNIGTSEKYVADQENKNNKQGSTPNNDSIFSAENYDIEIEINLSEPGTFSRWFQEMLIKDAIGKDPYTGESVLEDGQIVYPNYNKNFMDAQRVFMTAFDQALNSLGSKANITYKEIHTALDNANEEESAGQIIHKADGSTEIDVRWNKYKGLSRKSEIVAHEIFHMLTHKVFGNDQHMIEIFEQLRDKAVESGITYEIFLQPLINNNIQPTQNDIDRAKMMFDYVFDPHGDPEEFIAYAATNQEVFTAIQDIQIEPEFISYLEKNENTGRAKARFIDFINKMILVINKVYSAMMRDPKVGAQIVVDATLKMVKLQSELQHEELNVEPDAHKNKLEEYIDKYDSTMRNMLMKFDTQIDNINQSIIQGEKLSNVVNRLEKIAIIGQVIKSHLLQNIATQLFEKTDNPDVAEIYEVFRQGKEFTEKTRTEFNDSLKRKLTDLFGNKDKRTRQVITKAIFQTDLPSIRINSEYVNLDMLKELLTDDEAVNELIRINEENLRNSLNNIPGYTNDDIEIIFNQANGLAEYMVTGRTNVQNQQLNADNIINQFYKNIPKKQQELYSKPSEEKERAIEILDTIITLKSLLHLSENDKSIAYEYLNEAGSAENVISTMKMYREYVDNTSEMLRTTIYKPVRKGYMPEVNNEKMKFEIIPETDLKYYTSIVGGMKNIGSAMTINGVKYYKVIGKEHSLGFDEGIFSISSDPIDGISLKTLLIDHLTMLENRKSKSERSERKTVEDMATNIINMVASGDRSLVDFDISEPIPVYDFIGNVIDFKVQLDKNDKINQMKMDNDIIESAAYGFSRMIHRKAAMLHNMRAVDTLLDYANKNVESNPEAFITIKKYNEETDNEFDEDIHGRWNRIPAYTRNYIYMKTGKYEITIPANKLELITGEKEVTFGNANLGLFRLNQFPRIYHLIIALEDYWKEITSYVRETIAIRTGGVVSQNFISNMFQVWLKSGISPIEYIKRFKKKWHELDKYRELNKEYNDISVQIVSATEPREVKRLRNKLKMIENQMKKNSFNDLVEDGQFSPIIEDININEINNGHIAIMIENALNKNELTKKLKPIRDTLFVTRNTALYKSMMKFTQYGDIITREILRDEWVLKKKGRYTQEEYQQYLNTLDQMFVNYGYLDNRYLKHAERVFGVFFTKFFLRQMKAIYKIAIEHPARFTGLIAGEKLLGINIPTADDNYWHFVDSALRRLPMYGPEDIIDEAIEPNLFNILPSFRDFIQFK